MITSDGYWLSYNKNKNRITIYLPQTMETVTNTVGPIVNRRVNVEDAEFTVLLQVAKMIFDKMIFERRNDA